MTEYGKFNSLDELKKGYAELERSFTQKCQQLAALQQQSNGAATNKETPSDNDGLVSPDKNITDASSLSNATDDTTIGTQHSTIAADSIKVSIESQNAPTDATDIIDSTQNTLQQQTSSVPEAKGESLSSRTKDIGSFDFAQLQQFLQQNPQVLQQILQADKGSLPPTVMSGGGNVSLALPSRPKTIKEASIMAKNLFK